MAEARGGRGRKAGKPRLRMVGAEGAKDRPDVAIYALDRESNVLHSARVGDDGTFDLPAKVIEAADRIAVGPAADSFEDVPREALAFYRPARLAEELSQQGELVIAPALWKPWFYTWTCVHGSVRRCYFTPWVMHDLALRAADVGGLEELVPAPASVAATPAFRAELAASKELAALIPKRCDPICDGVVEVYRRTCCCKWNPVVIDDVLGDLVKHLEKEIPKIKWPPGPDPAPWGESAMIHDGAVDERLANAAQDLRALTSLRGADRAEYIEARPYLCCGCGPAKKVAQGTINTDGKFFICWKELARFHLPGCRDQYAYVVKQFVNGAMVTIYDGVSAGAWFASGAVANLTSYHPLAQACRHNDFPGDGAFCLLQDIGSTGSFHLKTPAQNGWGSVNWPFAFNDGLAFPVPTAAGALGLMKNVNWGGTLALRYHFSELMKGAGARYYRVSVVAAGANGAPTGPRTYLSAPVTWQKYVLAGSSVSVVSQNLGPQTVGAETNLFTIPYDADADWLSGAYHAYLNTTAFPQGRYLLMLEVFGANGVKLKPSTAPATDPGTAAPFAFLRRTTATATAPVPFGALTHLLWWDNRAAQALIVDLRMDGVPNAQECQFLEGNPNSGFSSGYRAYTQEPMFHYYHSLWWRRGLGGPSGTLTSPSPMTVPVGKPPSGPGISVTATFSSMLGAHQKCSFSLNLSTYVKTFNGFGRLQPLDDHDQAAFALEQ